jgi:hypothetical protein
MTRPRSSLPGTMRGISAAQLVADSRSQSSNSRGSLSLLTNRGNTNDYVIVSGIHPQPFMLLHDSGENVHGDGLSWILSMQNPVLISGNYDPGLSVRCEWGLGGARESMILNASPGFQVVLPGDAVDVFIISTSDPPVALDSVTRIAGIIHRGNPSGHEEGHQSFVIPAAQNTNVPVPSYAKDFGVYGNEIGVPGAGAAIFQPTSVLSILTGTGGVPPISYTGTTLLAMFRAGLRIQVPGNATQINMTYPHVLVDSFLLDFGF